MKRCANCKEGKLTRMSETETVTVFGHVFSADVPAYRCAQCNETYVDGPALERFELRAAVELAKAGATSGEVMRFMRKALGFRAIDLAELLDVAPETLSRWETGKQPIEHRAMALLDSLVLERNEGRTTTLDSLRALKKPKPLGKKVKLA
jgi:putative zinc finger/helix-turn-helix YgiT family protein